MSNRSKGPIHPCTPRPDDLGPVAPPGATAADELVDAYLADVLDFDVYDVLQAQLTELKRLAADVRRSNRPKMKRLVRGLRELIAALDDELALEAFDADQ